MKKQETDRICTSGFVELELALMIEIVDELGGHFMKDFKKNTSVLISKKVNSDKCIVIFHYFKFREL